MYSMDDTDGLGLTAPKPLDTASMDKGSFEQLSRGQGAVRPRHAEAQEDVRVSRRMLIAIVVASIAVVVAGVVLFARALGSAGTSTGSEQVMREQVGTDGSVTYNGTVYSLTEKDGAYSLTETRTEGEDKQVVVGGIPGTPVTLILFDGAIIIPVNMPDGTWQVGAYTIGAGGWSPVGGRDGAPSTGTGAISEAALAGSTLRLTVDGNVVEVPLVW